MLWLQSLWAIRKEPLPNEPCIPQMFFKDLSTEDSKTGKAWSRVPRILEFLWRDTKADRIGKLAEGEREMLRSVSL